MSSSPKQDESLSIESDNAVSTWFQEPRHVEEIEGIVEEDSCREFLKESNNQKVKTVSVAIVLCLNIGVDPPGRQKPVPSARLEAWVDPVGMVPAKAEAQIALTLQKNYERWQPRARYKNVNNPDIDQVRKLCIGLRRNSKDDRILFHYNGHGVPPPTEKGEIWLFNDSLTQYMPYSILDLQLNTGSPSIYVWDCNSAGTAVRSFVWFAEDQVRQWFSELDERIEKSSKPLPNILANMTMNEKSEFCGLNRMPDNRDCIHLAACSEKEVLPLDADLPADFFTSCLLTPVRTSVMWYILKNKNKHRFPADFAGNIPGHATDRRTLLGELNWIFTAITDTIAWNVLPNDTFQKLFRHDLLVASLFRSFLLAQRIMKSFHCHPITKPDLPAMHNHPLWDAWEYTLDYCLSDTQESSLLSHPKVWAMTKELHFVRSSLRYNVLININHENTEHHSMLNSFFYLQLKSFDIWLKYQSYSAEPPQQLPVLLQMLLSQFYRFKALELLARFIDLGTWAIQQALSVGIFPYVLKILFTGAARELKPWLAFIWAKILAINPESQVEVLKDSERSCTFFIQFLNDPNVDPRHRVVPAFVLAALIQNNFKLAQEALTDKNFALLSTELLLDNSFHHCPHLRLWLLIGLGRLWVDFNKARWQAIRLTLHEKVLEILKDKIPEVRAAAVYALGCLVKNSSEYIEHAAMIHHNLCRALCQHCTFDGSVLVRSELLVALQWFIIDFENQFANLSLDLNEKVGKDWLYDMKTTSVCEPADLSSITEGIQDSSHNITKSKRTGLSASFFATLPRRSTSMTFDTSSKKNEELSVIKDSNPWHEQDLNTFDFEKRVLKQIALIEAKPFNPHAEVVWLSLLRLSIDPEPKVARMARVLINHIEKLARSKHERKRKLSHVERMRKESETEIASVTFTVGSPDGNPSEYPNLKEVSEDVSYISSSNHIKSLGDNNTPRDLKALQLKSDAFMSNFHPSATFTQKRHIYTPTISNLVKLNEENKKLPAEALISTDFVSWCSRMFVEPIIDLIQVRGEDRLLDAKSVMMVPSDWALHTAEGIYQTSKEQTDALLEQSSRCDHQKFSIKVSKGTSCLAWSELRPHLYSCDGRYVNIWRCGSDRATTRVRCFDSFNGNQILKDKVCDIHVLNGMTREILMTCSEDGLIRIWDPCYSTHSHAFTGENKMISTAYLLNDLTRISTGGRNRTIYKWNQESGRLIMAGNLKVCRVWDAHAEKAAFDVGLQIKGKSLYPTCLSTDIGAKDVIATGMSNGEVHIYDIRVADNANAVARIGRLGQSIVGVGVLSCISTNLQSGLHIVAGSKDGELCLWEPRMFKECIWQSNICQSEKTSVHEELKLMEVQKSTKLLACITTSPSLKLFDVSGRLLTDRHYEEQSSDGKVNIPRVLRFHNMLVTVAVATNTQITAYEVRKMS